MEINGEEFYLENTWEEILDKSGVTFVRRSTGVLVACCPFHHEKTPSIHFWNKSRRFRCHGCGYDGDRFYFFLMMNVVLYPKIKTRADVEGILKSEHWLRCSDSKQPLFPDTGTILMSFMDEIN